MAVATGDLITAAAYNAILDALKPLCNGRITLETGVPVSSSDQTAKTSVLFTPYGGNQIALYDGSSAWNVRTFTELSLSLGSDAANTNYDLFCYDNSGTAALERLAWTNDSTRATALTTQNGVRVKSGATTRRYLGTYRTTGTVGQCEDSLARRLVWNNQNRVSRPWRVIEATDSWNYTTATWRQTRASAANQVDGVFGVAEESVEIVAIGQALNATVPTFVTTGIGKDVTNAPVSGSLMGLGFVAVTNTIVASHAQFRETPAAGYHFYAWLEYSQASGTTTWYGDNAGTVLQSGITGTFRG